MKYVGIDYGSRNVGIALSDEDGTLAFPKETLLNTSSLVDDICTIMENEEAVAVVLGESKDFYGEDNPIMEKIAAFKKALEDRGIPVHMQSELFSTKEASRLPERFSLKKEREIRIEKSDASAAAIILQSYLDTQKTS